MYTEEELARLPEKQVAPLDFEPMTEVLLGDREGFVMFWRKDQRVTTVLDQVIVSGHLCIWQEMLESKADTLAHSHRELQRLRDEVYMLEREHEDQERSIFRLEEERDDLEDDLDEERRLVKQMMKREDHNQALMDALLDECQTAFGDAWKEKWSEIQAYVQKGFPL